MSISFDQTGRFGRLTTNLGDSALALMRFNGEDAVNALFTYYVEAISLEPDIDLGGLIGSHANIAFETLIGETRHFDGIVTEAENMGGSTNGNLYRLTLRPWFWLCGQRKNHRIFHNKTVVQIIEEVFGDWSGASDPLFENRLASNYPELEYTVQYGESDLDFITRQMERFGISYHFTHTDGGHTLVMTDMSENFTPLSGQTRPYVNAVGEYNMEEEHFWGWKAGRGLTTGAVRMADFNFKTPKKAMEVDRAGDPGYDAHGAIESYYYPGDYPDQGAGKSLSNLRLTQEQSRDRRHRVQGNVTTLSSGMIVGPKEQKAPVVKPGPYVCLMARHSYTSDSYGSGDTDTDEMAYRGEYVLTELDAPYAPERKTARPIIHGPQTAMVVGEGEIDCDEHGRILVRFHWDLAGANSMRCRVVQTSASGEWGGMIIPRIGMEAVVEFLEGDPDKPMVTGCVFNGGTDSPYQLPAHKTKHVMRADTHQGSGFNEISFEAEAGQENMAIHAQKDQTIRVLNDQSANIAANRIENIGANASTAITANMMERVGANKSITVGGGGSAGLLQMLMPLVQAGGKFLKKGAQKGGAPGSVMTFAGGVAGVADMPKELAAIAQKQSFSGSGEHRSGGGAAQLLQGAIMSALLGKLMPETGSMNTTVERHKKDTIGQSATEQIGVAKNTVVGNVMTTSVGKLKKTKVGEDYELETKKSIFSRTRKHVLHAKDKFTIAGPGGTIIIDKSGITIKTKHLKVKSPKVDFTSGAPDQVDALKSDKAFVQDCKGK
ncbi:type VI secretion system Vgr family protein [Yoonia sp. 2307UL14-13]|uniref:type VI secretion system Vgr family protein n=1 Tax=Yoonia sp. 2307UL14-13 TaxID=3126506 RepID=UPI0030B4F170